MLVTPLGRNVWRRDKSYPDLLADHAGAVAHVAESEGIPWIDLHGYSVDFIRKNGMERCRSYFHPEDYTHTNEYGACLFGAYMAKELARLFPGILTAKGEMTDFVPPDGLWEQLGLTGRRTSGEGQREQFDNMEKSTADLLRVIEEARKGQQD